jgi:hypothetical protein
MKPGRRAQLKLLFYSAPWSKYLVAARGWSGFIRGLRFSSALQMAEVLPNDVSRGVW